MNSMLPYPLINLLISTGDFPTNGWWQVLIGVVQYIAPFTLVPRFVLSLRELYARDLKGRVGGDIDTAFGLTSESGRGAALSAIKFAASAQNEGDDQGEEIQMEVREVHGGGSSAYA